MAELGVIEFECPRCLKNIRVSIDQAGQPMDCPSCLSSLLVPAPSGNAEDLKEPSVADVDRSSAPAEVDPIAELSVDGESSSESAQANRLIGEDPIEVDLDAPLQVDGISDFYSHADVYGVKCDVCDTRIHVRPDQANTEVKCPECFSNVFVPPPDKSKRPTQRWVKEGQGKDLNTDAGEDELKLSDPIERPKIDYDVDESYGLEPPAEDLLAPKPKYDDVADIPELIILDESGEPVSQPVATSSTQRPPAERKSARASASENKSRRELYEEAQRKQEAAESGTAYRPERTDETQFDDEQGFPNFDFVSLLSSSVEMLQSPGVAVRAIIAIALMSFGTIGMQWFTESPVKDGTTERTMIQGLALMAQWGMIGLVPYLLGVLSLWFTAGYIFRDAALGNRQIESWKNAGTSEVTATFLLFSFGFFISGLPAAFFTLMTLPLRILFGPLLLLGAWYSQAPFSVVNVDAYRNFSTEVPQWKSFYIFMAGLAFLAFAAGLIFWMRDLIPGWMFVLTIFVSVFAVTIVAAVTLVFAAVCGWHCGRVTEALEN